MNKQCTDTEPDTVTVAKFSWQTSVTNLTNRCRYWVVPATYLEAAKDRRKTDQPPTGRVGFVTVDNR